MSVGYFMDRSQSRHKRLGKGHGRTGLVGGGNPGGQPPEAGQVGAGRRVHSGAGAGQGASMVGTPKPRVRLMTREESPEKTPPQPWARPHCAGFRA